MGWNLAALAAGATTLAVSTAASAAAQGEAAHSAVLPHVDGSALGLVWALPFAGILLSIALCPLLVPDFWHHHYGKVAVFWAAVTAVPLLVAFGPGVATYEILHVMLLDYVPFIIMLLSLFTVAGGVRLKGTLVGTPLANTVLLAIGTLIASWMGTTGASMLMIRPLLRANEGRKYRVHTIVFFIFLVSNIGGSLTPLGDPPLFLGFLKGVSFFWTTTHLLGEASFAAAILLALYFAVDATLHAREGATPHVGPREPLRVEGGVNLLLLAGVVGAVLLSGVWQAGTWLTVAGIEITGQGIVRDVILLAITGLSIAVTAKATREGNGFSWGPILEVAKLFFGIFITIAPVIAILRAGREGALSGIVELCIDPQGQPVNWVLFWATGLLSSFLDNAPTYLVFFNLLGGDAQSLMGEFALSLAAVSAGAVFMGANSYIGNAPNFMVRAIAEEGGIRMPSFFGYMLWSVGILVPLFVLTTFVFFV